MSDTTALATFVRQVQKEVPTVTQEQVFFYFAYAEAQGLREMDLEDLVELCRTGYTYDLVQCSEFLQEAATDMDHYRYLLDNITTCFKDEPNLYL